MSEKNTLASIFVAQELSKIVGVGWVNLSIYYEGGKPDWVGVTAYQVNPDAERVIAERFGRIEKKEFSDKSGEYGELVTEGCKVIVVPK